MKHHLITPDSIHPLIHPIRGQQVILDVDLASLYGVSTKRLNEQVRRNKDRFPPDFMFQLNYQEVPRSRSQFATLKRGTNIKFLPYAFTEHGAIMAANVLRSKRAVTASIYIVRAFVQLKKFVATHKELAHKIYELEQQVGTHDKAIVSLFDAIRKMMTAPEPKERKIGFIQS